MITLSLIIGFVYGYISVKGQFCMNSGFSNVTRKGDTTKLKSFVLVILIQIIALPLLFSLLLFNDATNSFIQAIHIPPVYLLANIVGGFLFGIFMYYTAGCGAGIFYKIGEKKMGALFAVIGFVIGVAVLEKGFLSFIREAGQSVQVIEQAPIWQLYASKETSLLIAAAISITALGLLLLLLRKKDRTPKSAVWGWKKTGSSIGILGVIAWFSAIFSRTPYGMSIVPGVLDLTNLSLSWGLLFVLGIPMGAYVAFRKKRAKRFILPKSSTIAKRLMGGFGLGASASLAAGCTVGHGLTFLPLLSLGSLLSIIFIFLGSAMMGALTRN